MTCCFGATLSESGISHDEANYQRRVSVTKQQQEGNIPGRPAAAFTGGTRASTLICKTLTLPEWTELREKARKAYPSVAAVFVSVSIVWS